MGCGVDRNATGRRFQGRDYEDTFETVLSSLRDEATQEYIEDEDPERDEMPAWFDEERYSRGAELFEKNIFLMFTGKMAGLVSLLAVPSIVKVLVLTRKSGQPSQAFRRYVDTVRHMLFWYRSSLKDPNSLSRNSLRVVRNHHLRASASARRAGLQGISQFDLAITQFAFCGFAVLRRKLLGVNATNKDVQNFLHVWRTLGYIIGIQDRFNLCQFDLDTDQTDKLFDGICSMWLGPALTNPPEEFKSMSHALLGGVWCMMPVLEYSSFLHFTQELAGVPQIQRHHPKKVYSSLMLAFLHLVPNSMKWPILGRVFVAYHNINMRFSLYMSTYYPLLAWYLFPGNRITEYHKLVPNET